MNDFPHPCTHCGLCCIHSICPLGVGLLQAASNQGPCPFLEWHEIAKSQCGLIANPERYIPQDKLAQFKQLPLAEILGSGKGCCVSAQVSLGDGSGLRDFAALPEGIKTLVVTRIRIAQEMQTTYVA